MWLEQVFNTLQTATREAMKPYSIMDADYDLHHNQQKHYFCSNTTLKRWSREHSHNAANYIENIIQPKPKQLTMWILSLVFEELLCK